MTTSPLSTLLSRLQFDRDLFISATTYLFSRTRNTKIWCCWDNVEYRHHLNCSSIASLESLLHSASKVHCGLHYDYRETICDTRPSRVWHGKIFAHFIKNTLFLSSQEYLHSPLPKWKFGQNLALWALSSQEYPHPTSAWRLSTVSPTDTVSFYISLLLTIICNRCTNIFMQRLTLIVIGEIWTESIEKNHSEIAKCSKECANNQKCLIDLNISKWNVLKGYRIIFIIKLELKSWFCFISEWRQLRFP